MNYRKRCVQEFLPEGFEVLKKLRKKKAFEFVEGYVQESGY
jgi:hypothetical protein